MILRFWEFLYAYSEWAARIANAFIFFFTLLGFFALPGAKSKWQWILPGWFLGLNLFLLFAPNALHPGENPVLYLALIHAPWIFMTLDLFNHGKASKVVDQIPIQALLFWSLYRFMGLSHLFAIPSGTIPNVFAIEIAFGEFFTAFGALILLLLNRCQSSWWYRSVLLFWNAYGCIAILSTVFKMALANPELHGLRYTQDIHRYVTSFPHHWVTFFWIPVSLCIHVSIFYKLYARNTSALEQPNAETEMVHL